MTVEGSDCRYLFLALTHALPALVRMGVYGHTQPMAKDYRDSFSPDFNKEMTTPVTSKLSNCLPFSFFSN